MWKKIRVILLVALLLSFAAIGIIMAGETSSGLPKTTPLPLTAQDFRLGGLRIRMTYADVVKVMQSDPQKVSMEYGEQILEYSDGTTIYLYGGLVQEFYVESKFYPTPRGLAVGDTVDKAVALYGEPTEKMDSLWDYDMGSHGSLTIFFKGEVITALGFVLVKD